MECKPDVVVNVAPGVTGTATLEGPIAVASGGDTVRQYSFEPDTNTGISTSGTPGSSSVFTYTVTDFSGNTAQCSVELSIGLGESVRPWGSASGGFSIRYEARTFPCSRDDTSQI